MADARNQRIVERKLREQLKVDRARVQLGRISPFGLLELSRQRLRPSFQELSAQPCPTCHGLGAVRSVESAALQALRAVELEGMKREAAALAVVLPVPVAMYVLNQKRDRLIGLEQRYQVRVSVQVDGELVAGEYRLETTEQRTADEVPVQTAAQPEAAAEAQEEDADASGRRRRRRRRRRRKPGEAEGEVEALETGHHHGIPPAAPEPAAMAGEEALLGPDGGEPPSAPPLPAAAPEEMYPASERGEPVAAAGPPRRRTRTRRRRAAPERVAPDVGADLPAAAAAAEEDRAPVPNGPEEPSPEILAPGQAAEAAVDPGAALGGAADNGHADAAVADPAAEPAVRRPRRRRAPRPAEDEPAEPGAAAALEVEREEAPPPNEPELTAALVEQRDSGPPRRGWWSRFVRKDE
jgi:ribonuclease E